MTKVILVLAASMLPALAFADVNCPQGMDAIVALVNQQKTCYEADQVAVQCAMGSSADVSIAGAAGDICAKDFKGKLTPEDKTIYLTLIKKCQAKYAKASGTLYVGAEAFCEEGVGKLFSDLYSPIN